MPFARTPSLLSTLRKAMTPRSESVSIYVGFDERKGADQTSARSTQSSDGGFDTPDASPRVVLGDTHGGLQTPAAHQQQRYKALGLGSVSRWVVSEWDVQQATFKATSPWTEERPERCPKDKHVRLLIAGTRVDERTNRVVLAAVITQLGVADVRAFSKAQAVLLRLFAEGSRCFMLLCTTPAAENGMRERLHAALAKCTRYDLKNKEDSNVQVRLKGETTGDYVARQTRVAETNALKADAQRHMAVCSAVARVLLARIEITQDLSAAERFAKLEDIAKHAARAITACGARLPQRIAQNLPMHLPKGEADPRLGFPSGLMETMARMMAVAALEVEEEMAAHTRRIRDGECDGRMQRALRESRVALRDAMAPGVAQELSGAAWRRWLRMLEAIGEDAKKVAQQQQEEQAEDKDVALIAAPEKKQEEAAPAPVAALPPPTPPVADLMDLFADDPAGIL